MSCELVVSVKDAEGKLTKKPFLIYDEFTWSVDDPLILKCVKEVIDEFNGEVDDVKVRGLLIIK